MGRRRGRVIEASKRGGYLVKKEDKPICFYSGDAAMQGDVMVLCPNEPRVIMCPRDVMRNVTA